MKDKLIWAALIWLTVFLFLFGAIVSDHGLSTTPAVAGGAFETYTCQNWQLVYLETPSQPQITISPLLEWQPRCFDPANNQMVWIANVRTTIAFGYIIVDLIIAGIFFYKLTT